MNVSTSCPASTATGAAGQLFTMLLQAILATPCNLSNPDMWPKDCGTVLDDSAYYPVYDFIVVGAGSAGSVVAHRLAENTKWSILLIEAGGDPPITSEVPGLFSSLQRTDVDWGYYTEKSNHNCLGFKDGRCYWPRGKMLGGSSAMNAMLYIRGNKRDYDTWEELGNPGWEYEEVLKYFKASEDMRAAQVLAQDNNKFHAQGGDLKVDNFYEDQNPLRKVIIQSASDLGYSNLQDANGESRIGFARLQGTVDRGTRCSSAKAFLTHKQENLLLVRHAKATKILINPTNKQAVGVQFVIDGETYRAWSTNEVIVSCGAINSPQLLMLSGIGLREHLEDLGIPVIADLPVGQNLQDHLVVPIWMSLNTNVEQISTKATIDSIYDYFAHHNGAFSGIGNSDIGGFINTVNKSSPYPNTQMHFIFIPKNSTSVLATINGFGYVEDTAAAIIKSNREGDNLLFRPSVLNPRSFGEIKLSSNDFLDYPKIFPNYLVDDEDMNAALKAIRFLEKFIRTSAMQKIGAKFLDINLPNCRSHLPFGEDYWKCFIRNVGTTTYHPAGTVKMGPASDRTAVVDSRLRVHGIRRLRVVDASIMPKIISGNINAPTIMIGEKAAAMIKQDWQFL